MTFVMALLLPLAWLLGRPRLQFLQSGLQTERSPQIETDEAHRAAETRFLCQS